MVIVWPALQPPPVVIVIRVVETVRVAVPTQVSLAIETFEVVNDDHPPVGSAMVTVPELVKFVKPTVNVNWKLLPVLPATAVVGETVSVPLPSPVVAVLYGPTNGPPLPTGVAPAGWIASVLVSERARAMLTRPLPV